MFFFVTSLLCIAYVSFRGLIALPMCFSVVSLHCLCLFLWSHSIAYVSFCGLIALPMCLSVFSFSRRLSSNSKRHGVLDILLLRWSNGAWVHSCLVCFAMRYANALFVHSCIVFLAHVCIDALIGSLISFLRFPLLFFKNVDAGHFSKSCYKFAGVVIRVACLAGSEVIGCLRPQRDVMPIVCETTHWKLYLKTLYFICTQSNIIWIKHYMGERFTGRIGTTISIYKNDFSWPLWHGRAFSSCNAGGQLSNTPIPRERSREYHGHEVLPLTGERLTNRWKNYAYACAV